MSSIAGYQDNIAHAQSSLTNAESALMQIQNNLFADARAQIETGLNGTQSADERQIVATELRNLRDQLFQTLNSNASGTYYFGGDRWNQQPFTVDASGNLCYNGLNLNQDFDALDPIANPADQDILDQLKAVKSGVMYVDIGMGIKYDVDGNVERSTVFEYTVAGVNITGYGQTALTDDDGNPIIGSDGNPVQASNNLYNLLGQLADSFESADFNHEQTDQLFGQFEKQSMSVLNRLTDIGAKTAYLTFMNDRYETQTGDLEERQVAVEGANAAKTIVEFKSLKASYEAALQMGTYLIQPSIFNFMN